MNDMGARNAERNLLAQIAVSARKRGADAQLRLDQQAYWANGGSEELTITASDALVEMAHALLDLAGLLPVDMESGGGTVVLDGNRWLMPLRTASEALDRHPVALCLAQRVLDAEEVLQRDFADHGRFSFRPVRGEA